MKKKLSVLALAALLSLGACERDADVASYNLSVKADNFEISRRVVFYNGVTGEYMLEIRGLCALGNKDKARELTVTCKTGEGQYKKHFLGLSDNVTYFAEQIEPATASKYFYSVVFKPSVIVPAIQLR